MMENPRKTLTGTFTALVTPFNADGSVDFGALDALVDWQIEEGITGLVPCGTTGESATMNAQERQDVIAAVIKKVSGRVPVIAGTGGNNTQGVIEHQKRAKDAGATITLVATPYYNKPTDEGLYQHYMALLDAVDVPIMLYNVPGRTACDMKPEVVARLAKDTRIVGIKEATGDLDRVAELRQSTPETFVIHSGDDPTACALVLMGGDGVISVSSNPAPKAMTQMIAAASEGRLEDARNQHNALRPLFKALALESNPIPVKAAMVMQKRMEENYRLPLCPLRKDNRGRLQSILKEGGWV